MGVAATSKPTASDVRDSGELTVGPENPQPKHVWRAAAGLTAPIELGPDGALYLATRDGNLDVVEATGKLRFSVALGGVTKGPLFVDGKGNAFAATSTGFIVGIGAQGNRLFTYPSPVGVTRGLRFGPTLGLLLLGENDVVLGVNRAAYPIFRFDSPEPVVSLPQELFGFCVVVTNTGKFIAKDRAGKRFVHALGGDVTQVERTVKGHLWLRSGAKLVVFHHANRPAFEIESVRLLATRAFEFPTSNVEGATLTLGGQIRWLDATGAVITEHSLDERTLAELELDSPTLALDDEDTVWFATRASGVLSVSRSGNVSRTRFDDSVRGLRFDPLGRRMLVALASGAVEAVARQPQVTSGR